MSVERRSLRILKELGAYSAALYVFGFLIVRARLVALGVWTALPVLDANYLYEGGLFLVSTVHHLVVTFGRALVCAGAVIWIGARVFGPHLSRVSPALQYVLPWAQLAALTLLCFQTAQVAASVMDVKGLFFHPPVETPKPPYDAIVVLTGTAIALWFWLRRSPRLPAVFRHLTAFIAAALFTVYLPVVHALEFRCSAFPKALISTKADAPANGLLVQLAGERLVFYDLASRTVRTIPETDVRSIDVSEFTTLKGDSK